MKTKDLTFFAVAALLITTSLGYADLSDGLVAYYPFNGNAEEASGNPTSSDGTEYGGPYYVDSLFGQGIKFDGDDDWVYATSEDIIVEGTQDSFAISFWFKPTYTWIEGGSGYPHGSILGNVNNWVKADWLIVCGSSTSHGRLEFNLYDDGPPLVLYTVTNTWIADTWYHIIYNHDASTRDFSVYINGIFDNSITLYEDVGRNLGGEHFSIARYNDNFIDMTLDELRLYNRALEPYEIEQLSVIPVPGAVLLGVLGLSVAGVKLRKSA